MIRYDAIYLSTATWYYKENFLCLFDRSKLSYLRCNIPPNPLDKIDKSTWFLLFVAHATIKEPIYPVKITTINFL